MKDLNFRGILTRLYRKTSLTLVGGYWKTGKTNLGLHIAEKLLEYGLVSEVATNIQQDQFICIDDLETLKSWLSSNGHLKLYIFDEGNEHLPNTGFMSKKSVGVKSIIPQISKKRARLIVIAQDLDTIDKTFRSKSWWRGTFLKLTRTTVKFTGYWNKNKPIIINNVKPTAVKYDPYMSADFKDRASTLTIFKDRDRQILSDWSIQGKTCRELNIHTQELNRITRKFVARMLLNYDTETKEKDSKELIGEKQRDD